MKFARFLFASLSGLGIPGVAHGGQLINLDFESAMVVPNPDGFGNPPTAEALPGWSAKWNFYNDQADLPEDPFVTYNRPYLSGDSVVLIGPDSDSTDFHPPGKNPLQGSYSVSLWGYFSSARIWQTGHVPEGARLLQFQSNPGTDSRGFIVSLGGESLVTTERNGGVFEAEISKFAGTDAILMFGLTRFTGGDPPEYVDGEYLALDSIRFVVPEPESGVLVASALAGLGLAVRWKGTPHKCNPT